jgi:hypothetical protein
MIYLEKDFYFLPVRFYPGVRIQLAVSLWYYFFRPDKNSDGKARIIVFAFVVIIVPPLIPGYSRLEMSGSRFV